MQREKRLSRQPLRDTILVDAGVIRPLRQAYGIEACGQIDSTNIQL
jgi:hypothetical protein